MNFYPRQTRQGPRAVILPDCEQLLVHEFYVAGLIDTIYCKEARLLLELPVNVQQAIKIYATRLAKGREIFLKFTGTTTIFEEEDLIFCL